MLRTRRYFNGESRFKNVITMGVETPSSTAYWFIRYSKEDLPYVNFKGYRYLFSHSTDHELGTGGLYIGFGNYPDARDYVHDGIVYAQAQAETPFLMTFEGNTDKTHLYFHTNAADAGNDGRQQTRLFTFNGDNVDLVNDPYTDQGRPLGFEIGDNHTGYTKIQHNGYGLVAMHLKAGSPGAQYQFSTTTDGLSFTRGNIIDLTANADADRRYTYMFGHFFQHGANWYWIGTEEKNTPPNGFGEPSKRSVLCTASTSPGEFLITGKIANLTDIQIGTYEATIIRNTAHVFKSQIEDPIQHNYFNIKKYI